MVNVIGVRFQQNGKMCYFDADSLCPALGDYVVAETARGQDLGEVIMGVRPVEDAQVKTPLQKIIRLATEQDIQRAAENRRKETEAFSVCQQKIAEHKLEMKLVSVECSFDNSKILFYFTANGRVDFRALVRDLASVFKTRIELRQIGVRDEARMLGGLGPCGRPICCGSFLSDFQPVSIKMAKEQNLSLNPTKISGVCGRLMCCLKYEQDQYEQTRKKMPRVGREVTTPDGTGVVTALNIVKETVSVRVMKGDDGEIREYPLSDITRGDNRENSSAPVAAAEENQAEPAMPDDYDENMDADLEALSEEPPKAPDVKPEPKDAKKPAPERKKNHSSRPSRDGQKKKENENPQQKDAPREDRGQGNKAALGQVVRRENPARAGGNGTAGSSRETGARKKTEEPRNEAKPSASSKPSAKKSGGWAAAVEQALKAVDAEQPKTQNPEV